MEPTPHIAVTRETARPPTLMRQGRAVVVGSPLDLGASRHNLNLGQRLGWQGLRSPGLARCLESSDVGFVLEGQADVIQPFHEAPARVIVDLERHDDIATDHLTVHQVDGHFGARSCLEDLPDQLDVFLLDESSNESLLARVAAEDIGEPGGKDDAEPVVLQRPDCVFARGAGAKVGPATSTEPER